MLVVVADGFHLRMSGDGVVQEHRTATGQGKDGINTQLVYKIDDEIGDAARTYRIPGVVVDGQDVFQVYNAAKTAVWAPGT